MTIKKEDYIDYINVSELELKDLPKDINVSTMSATCKLSTPVNIDNIENYLLLNSNDIITVKINNDKIKTLETLKTKTKRKKKIESITTTNLKNRFYNQITVIVRVTEGNCKSLSEEPKINMKLFQNGSIQMSGCKSIKNINIALNKLIIRLSEIKGKIENNKIIEKKFVENNDNITIKNFKVNMINSNYKININIDRYKLYTLLNMKKIKCTFEPCIRACVIVKYIPPENNIDLKTISIFIFQKGNIIITGSRSKSHIMSAYEYINNILNTHINDISKQNDTDDDEILSLYSNIVKEAKLGLIKLKTEDYENIMLDK
jgi:TATA-box binding protein (TBP) (component of TFIID and TFIIIB)